ncbi:Uncharacterised protein [Aggregatibacter actinomycetemcomitans]|uniref:hypothetical protein n=1 Tax=Aggregatibacter actinomycetemcomitans TaxID=714 RepID=UPI0006A6C2BF|nr:hypothetical protein [Aggregatibacter actinomycetemcomitans]KOE57669.1 hypothetical protein SCC2302_0308855 [Aggregatibacter actinomycetemcomitans serotype c str. SCC2302]KOE61046.1 hypothetical protein AAS4A_0201870 [Aggregatibacter actinomycetemcomitans serotype c str. AAS4A]MCE3056231.1 hypothetical protein [Aggregatibacter actinomycetemcomitans]SSY84703.1 Uncharacterised protein [Aggregatibacter actinomycetemcomitans]
MNYALIGILLFLMSTNLTSGLKGADRKVKIKVALSYLCFFLLFGVLMVSYHFASSNLLENPIMQKLTQ